MSAWLDGVNRPLCCGVEIVVSHNEALCSIRNYIVWGLYWTKWHWVTLGSGFFSFPILMFILPSSYSTRFSGIMAPESRRLVSAKGSIPSRSTWNMPLIKWQRNWFSFTHFLASFIPLTLFTQVSIICYGCCINLESAIVLKNIYSCKSLIFRR